MRGRKKDELQLEIEELLELGGLSERDKGSSFRKYVTILLLTAAMGLLIILGGIYYYIHSCISKINVVASSRQSTGTYAEAEELGQEELLPDDEELYDDINKELEDSPQNEISTLEEEINQNYRETSSNPKKDRNVQNILLIGSDSREKGKNGRSDVMMLVSINKKAKKIVVTSILRDIYLQIPGKKNNRINAAFAYGGPELLLETLEKNFKISVDQYVLVDFYSFIDAVDAVGGLTLEVTEEDVPVINKYVQELNRLTGQEVSNDLLTSAGTYLLNGKQTLGYSRNRYVGNGDFTRTKKQRIVLEQMFQKVKRLSIFEIDNILNLILPQITTNLQEKEILSMVLSLPTYLNYDIEQWSIPAANTYKNLRINGMAVLGIDFNANITTLYEKVFE